MFIVLLLLVIVFSLWIQFHLTAADCMGPVNCQSLSAIAYAVSVIYPSVINPKHKVYMYEYLYNHSIVLLCIIVEYINI